MAARRSFKSDISFLEKISMGATGTIATLENLKKQGHNPIELERGSTSFKIWKNIKIKRIRVPDILCIDCGKCVECRTKTKLEISMSHSQADPERGWDYGLDDTDHIAFVVCKKAGDIPIDWTVNGPIQYVSVKDLRLARKNGLTRITKPKGIREGFEMRLIWPTKVANYNGTVTSINEDRIQYQRKADGRKITLNLNKKNHAMNTLVKENEKVVKNQIIASFVPVGLRFACEKSVSEEDYVVMLSNTSLSKFCCCRGDYPYGSCESPGKAW